jgi:uncharacterized protein (DUF433 family)
LRELTAQLKFNPDKGLIMAVALLSAREVADFAGASKRLVEKAIEERVLAPRLVGRAKRRPQRLLPTHAVAYAAVIAKLGIRLPLGHKKRLAGALARLAPEQLRNAQLELAPAVEVHVGRLVGDAMERAERYARERDTYLELNDAIKGGTPVIHGTRMTVYSVLGRVEYGDTIEDLIADNPDIPREAFEAALVYARTHPLVGRPGGRPWERSAE